MSIFGRVYIDPDEEICQKDMLDDLQLAAELGKTLLERNKELETSLKHHQNIIEDQTQEIEYLTKQTVALREVNDSRLRIYEQLEVSIHDLERANHRLTLDNAADKKQIKNLCSTIDTLEAKCEELQVAIDTLTMQLDTYKRKCQQQEAESANAMPTSRIRQRSDTERSPSELLHDKQVQCDSTSKPEFKSSSTDATGTDVCDGESPEAEQVNQLLIQLRDIRAQRTRDHRRITELEEQLAALVQENQALENQLVNITIKEDDMKSMHEELTTLEEVRQGQLCARCLRNIDDRMQDDMSILDPEEEDDDSMLEALMNSENRYHSPVSLNIQQDAPLHSATQSNNLYRDLVEKYEALLAVNRNHKPPNCMSLQEELQMSGEFGHAHAKDTDEESGHGDTYAYDKRTKCNTAPKPFSQTPTDFSEAETSSSGFADETSNKATQTDGRPGSFLCTIADGEDCKFSIYDDASPIDSRFRNRPEYRELFKEIFTVLKKAAENKDEGEELPLLDDCTPGATVPKVPPVTPATEDLPADFADDNQSVISSAMSDVSTRSIEPATIVENIPADISAEAKLSEPEDTPISVATTANTSSNSTSTTTTTTSSTNTNPTAEKEEKPVVLTPYKREPLEYLSVTVNVRKKASSKKNQKKFMERSDSPVLPLSPRISYLTNGGGSSSPGSAGRKRREPARSVVDSKEVWNGTTLQFWSTRSGASPTPGKPRPEKASWDFKPSPASQDLHKLKRLDLSYAEVLRNADSKKRESFAKSARRK